jgi:hypothetical protein
MELAPVCFRADGGAHELEQKHGAHEAAAHLGDGGDLDLLP